MNTVSLLFHYREEKLPTHQPTLCSSRLTEVNALWKIGYSFEKAMDYETARRFLVNQGTITTDNPDAFLIRLKQGKPPVPGQVTSLLLSLKVVFEGLREAQSLDRDLVYALHLLASESRHYFDQGQRSGVDWPPILNEDLTRISAAVRSIFSDAWVS